MARVLFDCPKRLRNFGEEFSAWIRTHPKYMFLVYAPMEFVSGGCWILAQALHQWIGPGSELWSIIEDPGQVQHVVVKVGSCFLDGWGASTRRELIQGWREEAGLRNPHIEKFDIHKAEAAGIECPGDVAEIASDLERQFGPGEKVMTWARG